jgi:PEP-CTERM motif
MAAGRTGGGWPGVAVACVLALAGAARAQVVVSVDSAAVAPGGSGFLTVTLTTAGTLRVTGLGLRLDLLTPDPGIRFTSLDFPVPASGYLFFNNSFDQANSLPFATGVAPQQVSGTDEANTGFVSVPAGATRSLARVGFAVDPSVAAGTVATVHIDPSFTQLMDNGSPPAPIPYTPLDGQITVTPVPEPAALALAGLAAAAGGALRLRRPTRAGRRRR